MQIAIPVEQNDGLDSAVYGHFGSAPFFALIDSETKAIEWMDNRDREHVHGQCLPMKALAGCKVDAVIVGGIGLGALRGLKQAGIRVFVSQSATLAETIKDFQANTLEELSEENACKGHHH